MKKNTDKPFETTYEMFTSEISWKKYGTIDPEWSKDLYREYMKTGDQNKRDELILRHVNYVLYYCRNNISSYKLSNHSGDFMDIFQEAVTGLLIAAHRYNPDKAAFLTYARYYIKVVIDNYLATVGNKSPFNTKDQVGAAVQAYHLLNSTQNETWEILQLEEVAQILGVSSRVLLQKLEAQAYNVISLDAPVWRGNEESTWGDILQVAGDVDTDHPYSTGSIHTGKEVHSIVLKEMRLNLSVREYNVVKMHYLDHSSLEEIAWVYCCSRERIRQIEEIALWKVLLAVKSKYPELEVSLETGQVKKRSQMDTKYHNVVKSALETQRKELKKQSRLSAQMKAKYVLEQLDRARINALNLSLDDMHGLCLYYIGNDQNMYESSEHIETLFKIAKYDPRVSFITSKREHQSRIYRNTSDEKEFFDWFFEQKSNTVPLYISEFIRKYYETDDKNSLLEGRSIDELIQKRDYCLKRFFEIPWVIG